MKRWKVATGLFAVTAGITLVVSSAGWAPAAPTVAGSMHHAAAAAADFNPNLDPGESITVSPAVKGIAPHPGFQPAPDTYHHEFQANCAPNHAASSAARPPPWTSSRTPPARSRAGNAVTARGTGTSPRTARPVPS